jgi:hypothetical protein
MTDKIKSPFYGNAFWVVLAVYFIFVELYFRFSVANAGSHVVFGAWLQQGNARILLCVIWSITTLAFIALAADHIRNIYVALTGKPETFIFLGDKLSDGMFVAREGDPLRAPLYVELFINKNQHPTTTFYRVYDRKILLQDAEGNLTPADMLNTGRLIVFSFLQLMLLLFSAMCVISVTDQFISGFPGTASITDLSRATTMPDPYSIAFVALLTVIYGGGIALVSFSMRSVSRARSKVLPLPAVIAKGADLPGTVVAVEDFTIDNANRSLQSLRFYRRYAVRFDEPGFPLPIYVNWSKQRIHEGNIGIAVGSLKKERIAQKERYDHEFEYLDEALKSGRSVMFRVGRELDITPQIESLSG